MALIGHHTYTIPCGVAVTSNPTVYNVRVFHAAVFGEMKAAF